MPRRPICVFAVRLNVVLFKSSAHFAGPLRPCGLLSTARGPAPARALPLALGLSIALALAVALALLRALALVLPLALRLALPLALALPSATFLLAGSGHMDPRRSQRRGGKMASWRRPWTALGAFLALGALLASSGGPQEAKLLYRRTQHEFTG